MNKIGLYFFVIASMLSIIDGAFDIISPELQLSKTILLVFSGIAIGVFLFSSEKDFLLGGISFILGSLILLSMLGPFFVESMLGQILLNFVMFLTATVIVVAFKAVIESVSEAAGLDVSKHEGVTLDHLKENSFEKIWGIVILIAVSFAILQLLLETFYDVSRYYYTLQAIDWIITALFIVDVIILYERAQSFKDFIFKNFFDILAAIPTVGMLRILKVVRAVRIVRIFKSSAKLTKLLKLNKTTKFFSEESDIKHYTKSATKTKKAVKKKTPAKKKSLKTKSKSKK